MSTNIAGAANIGELGACVVRAARLNSNCAPTGGVNGGIVTAGLVTMTVDPQIEEGTKYEPKNACGSTLYTAERDDKILRQNISGEFGFSDFELMALLFGGSVILGKVGGDFAGEVIGYYDPLYSSAPRNGAYLEVITTAIEEGAGSCVASDGGTPVAIGHIFGKTKLRAGSATYADQVINVAFSGTGTNNPNLFNGPWNDYPGAGYTPNSSHVRVGYTQAEYDAILAAVTVGYVDLPTGS